MKYGKAIYSILSNHNSVTNIVSNRVYPVRAYNDAPFPYVVYTLISNDPVNEKHRVSTADIVSFQVSCFANNHEQAADLSEAVREALEKQSGTFNGIEVEDIAVISTNTGFDEDQDVHHIPLDFELFINR